MKISDAVNGIDVKQLKKLTDSVVDEPITGQAIFAVTTAWKGGTATETEVKGYELGGKKIGRTFKFDMDEPNELLGQDGAATPLEYLMGAMNACMAITFICAAAMRNIKVRHLEIETEGHVDLRGFLGVDEIHRPGCDTLRYVLRVDGDATRAEFRQLHEEVMRLSSNYFNIANPVKLDSRLEVTS